MLTIATGRVIQMEEFHSEDFSDEFIHSRLATAKKYPMILLRKGPNYASSASLQLQHVRYQFWLRKIGALLIDGPLLDDGDIVGVGIFGMTDLSEVRRLMDDDPGIMSGRFVYELAWWMGFPGDRLT
jgi:hypothetical protein